MANLISQNFVALLCHCVLCSSIGLNKVKKTEQLYFTYESPAKRSNIFIQNRVCRTQHGVAKRSNICSWNKMLEKWLNGQTCSSNMILDENVWMFSRGFKLKNTILFAQRFSSLMNSCALTCALSHRLHLWNKQLLTAPGLLLWWSNQHSHAIRL